MKNLYEEIKEAVQEYLQENEYTVIDGEILDVDECEIDAYDVVNELYNEDYYIIGIYQAKQWLKQDDNLELLFDALEDYQSNFGEQYPNITDIEKLVSLTVLLYAEQNISDILEDIESGVE